MKQPVSAESLDWPRHFLHKSPILDAARFPVLKDARQ
jgi:hypothetical protein